MLKYNLERLFKLRGITNPSIFLQNNGLKGYTALRIVNKKFVTLTTIQIEQLCIIFNCTPNDLMEWAPDNTSPQNENLALKKLIVTDVKFNLNQISRDVPIDKLEMFAQKVEELKKSL